MAVRTLHQHGAALALVMQARDFFFWRIARLEAHARRKAPLCAVWRVGKAQSWFSRVGS